MVLPHRRATPGRKPYLAVGTATLALALGASACSSSGGGGQSSGGASGKVGVSLILKTLSNPYFVTMEQDAKTEAATENVRLTVAAGTDAADTQTQIAAIDNAISRGDKGILITLNGDSVNAELRKARAAGLFVIALDTPPTPPDVVDVTYATDNEQAGKLIGQYAAAKLNGAKAVIAMLDALSDQVVSVDVQRDHGFLEGMGINPGNQNLNGKEAKTGKYSKGDYQVVCHQATNGSIPGGKTAMENCLSANSDVNVVYAVNEPAADGAYQALQAAGKSGVTIVTIDGSCRYVNDYVATGKIAADAAQFPGRMASEGVKAIAQLARGGTKPTNSAGLSFFNTGTALVTKDALPGLASQSPEQASKDCWGS